MRKTILLAIALIMSFAFSMLVFANSETLGTTMRYGVGKNDLELYIGGLTATEERVYYSSEQDNRLFDFPVFKNAPFGLRSMGSAIVNNWSKPTVINSNCYYSNLHIESTLEIDTRYRDVSIKVNNLKFGSNGHIIIKGSGKVYLFVDGNLTLSNGSSINNNGNYESLELYHSGNQVTFQGGVGGKGRYKFSGILNTKSNNIIIENGARLNGCIYAERADITIRGVELDTKVIYTKRGNVIINNGGKLGGLLVVGGDRLTISGGSKFDGRSGGIYALDARVSIEQGAIIIGKIVANSEDISIKNINEGKSNYWIVSSGDSFDYEWRKQVLIKEVIICSTVGNPYFELYYWDNYGWKRVYLSNVGNGVLGFYEEIGSNRLLIKNPYNNPITEIIIR